MGNQEYTQFPLHMKNFWYSPYVKPNCEKTCNILCNIKIENIYIFILFGRIIFCILCHLMYKKWKSRQATKDLQCKIQSTSKKLIGSIIWNNPSPVHNSGIFTPFPSKLQQKNIYGIINDDHALFLNMLQSFL